MIDQFKDSKDNKDDQSQEEIKAIKSQSKTDLEYMKTKVDHVASENELIKLQLTELKT